MILPYFDWLTDTPTKEITELRNSLESQSVNPIELKKNVAYKLVTDFHNAKSARLSRDFFEKTVQEGQAPDDIPEYVITSGDAAAGIKLSNVLVSCGLTSSSGEARRLIEQGAVRINEIQITQNQPVDQLEKGILRAGRRRYVRLI